MQNAPKILAIHEQKMRKIYAKYEQNIFFFLKSSLCRVLFHFLCNLFLPPLPFFLVAIHVLEMQQQEQLQKEDSSSPNHQRWHAKAEARSECVHVAYTFFALFGANSLCSLGAYLQKLLCRSSGGSLLRVRCWLGSISISIPASPSSSSHHDFNLFACMDRKGEENNNNNEDDGGGKKKKKKNSSPAVEECPEAIFESQKSQKKVGICFHYNLRLLCIKKTPRKNAASLTLTCRKSQINRINCEKSQINSIICDKSRINRIVCDKSRINRIICNKSQINRTVCDKSQVATNHLQHHLLLRLLFV